MNTAYLIYFIIIYPVFWLLYRMKPKFRERIPEGPALVCANHSSYLDIIFLSLAFGKKHYLKYVAKRELLKIPVFGQILKWAGVIGIGRGSSDITAIKNVLRALKEGNKVVIFPEGTRVKDDSAAAKTGAIMLASRSGVPVIPVNIPRNKKLFSINPVIIGEPYKIERIKGGTEAYDTYANELMSKINNLPGTV